MIASSGRKTHDPRYLGSFAQPSALRNALHTDLESLQVRPPWPASSFKPCGSFYPAHVTCTGLPLSLTIPALGASLAYLNAKAGISQDLGFVTPIITSTVSYKRRERRDRVNLFYTLEEYAQSHKTAHNPFIAVPPAISKEALASKSNAELAKLKCDEWTYAQVYQTVLKYAAWLKQEHGVSKDEIVALDCTNNPEFVFLWFALWSLGAKPAFINTNLRGKAFLHCVRQANARLLLLDSKLQDALSQDVREELASSDAEKSAVTVVVVDDEATRRVQDTRGLRAADEERSGAKISDMAILIYTSGTTGLPKAANVTWRKTAQAPQFVSKWLGVKRSDRYYSALPLYHTSASVLGLCVSLHAGAAYIISPHFSPSTFFASAAASRATMVQYIGEMCRYLLSTRPSAHDTQHKIRIAFGNGLRPDVWQQFKDRFSITEIAEFYGATEAVSATFVKSRNSFGRGIVGRTGVLLRAVSGRQSAIVAHDVETGEPYRDPKTGFCARVATGESGEMINAIDPANMGEKYAGYFGNEKASQSKILRDVFGKGDAWYRTGDLLRTDADGRTWFVDRIGDTFRWKAENVSTNEVAEVVSQHASVKEVNVYGIELPNHDGRAGCAAIILADSEPGTAVLRDLATHNRKRLPKFAVPLFLRVVKSMEVTGTNKYTKHGLRTEGVDPAKTGQDKVFWLPPGKESYEEFGKKDWERIVGGSVKL